MSTEKEALERLSTQGTSEASSSAIGEDRNGQSETTASTRQVESPIIEKGESSEEEGHPERGPQSPEVDKKPAAKEDETVETEATGSLDAESTRQVIAVNATKGPAAFFNLARKFLVTDEMCDLSALEGAIVSAVDAAHLLERSQLATIVRINTSYVTVEPKRRKQVTQQEESSAQAASTSGATSAISGTPATRSSFESGLLADAIQREDQGLSQQGRQRAPGGRELRRARIIITVRKSESYKRWLQENPLQAIIAGAVPEAEEDDAEGDQTPPPKDRPPKI